MIDIFFYSTVLFFAFWLINHSELLEKVRVALFPTLPKWLGKLLSCPLCFTFWTTGALCFFWYGYIPALLTAPVFVMFIDLAYQRLKGDK